MYILGINAAYHQSSACLVRDGQVIAAAEEERFTRIKHAKSARIDNPDELPWNAIEYCLERAAIKPSEIDAIGFSIDPDRRLGNARFDDYTIPGEWGTPEGELEFNRRLHTVPDQLRRRGFAGSFHWLNHHLCHAASAFFPSPHRNAAILVVDGIGEISSTSSYIGAGSEVTRLASSTYPHSIGFLWEKLSTFLGFSEYDACKVMGLAAFGDSARFRESMAQLARADGQGAFTIDGSTLRFRVQEFGPIERCFNVQRRTPEAPMLQVHADIAAALQQSTEEILLSVATKLRERTGAENLCMAGGVALNCVANRRIANEAGFSSIYVQPAADDAGTALGAALWLAASIGGADCHHPAIHSYLGPEYTDSEIEKILAANGLVAEHPSDIAEAAATELADGQLVGWFQGQMEFGPRALGNRSLLADPTGLHTKDIVNQRVKHREDFRPFGASVLQEDAAEWFDIPGNTNATEFMLITCPVRKRAPDGTSLIPAVTHVDGTCRIQVVRQETNPAYHRLLKSFKAQTGVPLLLNTSFNDSEPVVCSPQDAVRTFRKSRIDVLAIGGQIVRQASVGEHLEATGFQAAALTS